MFTIICPRNGVAGSPCVLLSGSHSSMWTVFENNKSVLLRFHSVDSNWSSRKTSAVVTRGIPIYFESRLKPLTSLREGSCSLQLISWKTQLPLDWKFTTFRLREDNGNIVNTHNPQISQVVTPKKYEIKSMQFSSWDRIHFYEQVHKEPLIWWIELFLTPYCRSVQ